MLHQLKNGNWVDLGEVLRVGYFDPSEWGLMLDFGYSRTDRRPYVVVSLKGSGARDEQVHFDTMDEVRRYRDELATLVNTVQGMAIPKSRGKGYDLDPPFKNDITRPKTWRDRAIDDPTFTREG